jgi:hypothetical protein
MISPHRQATPKGNFDVSDRSVLGIHGFVRQQTVEEPGPATRGLTTEVEGNDLIELEHQDFINNLN